MSASRSKEPVRKDVIASVSNAGASAIEQGIPYNVDCTISGVSDILFHRWNDDAVEAKSKSAKGSKAKKSDDIESYVWRDEAGNLCLPGDYLRGAIVAAAKFRQDPRSPRKSAQDLFRAGVVATTALASLGVKDWDYVDRRRVLIQRNAISRHRPALRTGWSATVGLLVLLPQYISPELLLEVIGDAGRLVGVGDFRPTFGRFAVSKFDIGFEA